MEEEARGQPFGLPPTDGPNGGVAPAASLSLGQPSAVLPASGNDAGATELQGSLQNGLILEADAAAAAAIGGPAPDHSPPLFGEQLQQQPAASLDEAEPQASLDGAAAAAPQQNFTCGGAFAQDGSLAAEAEGDVGTHTACEQEPLNATPGLLAEDAGTETESPGGTARLVDAGGPMALAEGGGDAGGMESDGKESNDSVCNECGGGGEVVCCDGCVKSYHTDCLPVAARPRLRANADDWYCPECASSSVASPPAVSAPPAAASKAPPNGSRQNSAPASPPPAYPPPATAAAWAPQPTCGPVRRRKTKAAEDYETRINVGPNHQVPHLPDFFLARGDTDCLSTLAEQSLADGSQSQALGPLLVYSPYLLERSKQQCLSDRAAKSCITSQKDLAEFLIKCSRRWKVRPGWQPFSPEFAYKLLHRANYDPERALRMMDDSAFCFQSICDPPLRKYENKWKRRDKRGTFPSSPYPPPVVVRGYLNEKQRQLRMGR
ncbi:hypothetical protein Efla_004920 [Eimeria flavescens]